MKRTTAIAIAVLVVTFIVQFVPLVHTGSIMSEVEDASKTWSELPAGFAGKPRSSTDWPTELRYNEYEDWAPETKAKYHLVGEHNISTFIYVWNPSGALSNRNVVCYILMQIFFVILALVTFLTKSGLGKSFVACLLGIACLYAGAMTFAFDFAYNATGVAIFIVGIAALVLSYLQFTEYLREKKAERLEREAELAEFARTHNFN